MGRLVKDYATTPESMKDRGQPRDAMTWDKNQKPPADICPGRYCFMWMPVSGATSPDGTFLPSRGATSRRAEGNDFPDGNCGCEFGVCTRLDPVHGDHDWYETDDPNLRRDGLPWFYFIPSAEHLVPEFREQYLRESHALWGEGPDPEPDTVPDGQNT